MNFNSNINNSRQWTLQTSEPASSQGVLSSKEPLSNSFKHQTCFEPVGGKRNHYLFERDVDGNKILTETYQLQRPCKAPFSEKLEDMQLCFFDMFLQTGITQKIELESKTYHATFTIRELLVHLIQTRPKIIDAVDIVGGVLRKLLRSSVSRNFWKQIAKKYRFPLPDLSSLLTLSNADSSLPDVDVRFRIKNATRADLAHFTNTIIRFLSKKLHVSESLVKQHCFSKFNLFIKGDTAFSIATFGNFNLWNSTLPSGIEENSAELELIFVKSLQRESLFVHDSWKVDILPLLIREQATATSDLSTKFKFLKDTPHADERFCKIFEKNQQKSELSQPKEPVVSLLRKPRQLDKGEPPKLSEVAKNCFEPLHQNDFIEQAVRSHTLKTKQETVGKQHLEKVANRPVHPFELELKSSSQSFLQPFIDLCLKVLHVNNPGSVNASGFMTFISLISKGYLLGAKEDINQRIRKKIVLPTLRSTFLRAKLHDQTLEEYITCMIKKCLNNHHQGDLLAPIILTYNLQIHLKHVVSCKTILTVWEAIYTDAASDLLAKNPPLAVLIAQALVETKIPFEVTNAILSLACTTTLSCTPANQGEPAVCLVKHMESPFIQIKTAINLSGYLLIPFRPVQSLKKLEEHVSEKGNAQDLATFFNRVVASFKPSGTPSESILKANENYFLNEFERLCNRAIDIVSSEKNYVLRYISFHLLLSLPQFEQKKYLTLFEQFPAIVCSRHFPEEGGRFAKAFQRALLSSPFQFVQHSLNDLRITSPQKNSKKFLQSWIVLLAKSQDKHLGNIARSLWSAHSGKYPEKMRTLFTSELAQHLLPKQISHALSLTLQLQKMNALHFSPQEEMNLIGKILACGAQPMQYLPQLFEIYNAFLDRLVEHPLLNRKKTQLFAILTEQFLRSLFLQQHLLEGKQLLERVTELKILLPNHAATASLWELCLRSLNRNTAEEAFECYMTWKKANTLGVWKGDTKTYHSTLLNVVQMLTTFSSLKQHGYHLLKDLSSDKQVATSKTISSLICEHLDSLLQSAEEKAQDTAVQMLFKFHYCRHLNAKTLQTIILSLIDVYIALRSFEKVVYLWKRLVNLQNDKTHALEAGKKTEKILNLLLKGKENATQFFHAHALMTSKQYAKIAPSLPTPWLTYPIRLLKNAARFSPSTSRLDIDVLICHFLELAYSKTRLNSSQEELETLAVDVLYFLQQKERIFSEKLKKTISQCSEGWLSVLWSRSDSLAVCQLINLLNRLKIPVDLGNESSKNCLLAIQKLATSPSISDTILTVSEQSMEIYLKREFVKTIRISKEMQQCYKDLATAHFLYNQNIEKTLIWIRHLMRVDPECLHLGWYRKMFDLIAPQGLLPALDLLESFAAFYESNPLFHRLPEASNLRHAKDPLPSESNDFKIAHSDACKSLPGFGKLNEKISDALTSLKQLSPTCQLKIFQRHQQLFLKVSSMQYLTKRVGSLILKLYETAPPKNSAEYLKILQYFPIPSAEFAARFLAQLADAEDNPCPSLAMDVFEPVLFASNLLFTGKEETLLGCWKTMFNFLKKKKSTKMQQLVFDLHRPGSSGYKVYAELINHEGKAQATIHLLKATLELLQEGIRLTEDDEEHFFSLLQDLLALDCSDSLQNAATGVAQKFFSYLLGIKELKYREWIASFFVQRLKNVSFLSSKPLLDALLYFLKISALSFQTLSSDQQNQIAAILKEVNAKVKDQILLEEIASLYTSCQSKDIAAILASYLTDLSFMDETNPSRFEKLVVDYCNSACTVADSALLKLLETVVESAAIYEKISMKTWSALRYRLICIHLNLAYPNRRSNLEERKNATEKMLLDCKDICHCEHSQRSWTRKFFELVVPLSLNRSTLHWFIQRVRSFFEMMQEGNARFNSAMVLMQRPEEEESETFPVFYCSRFQTDQGIHEEKSKQFFYSMNLMLDKIVAQPPREDTDFILLSGFVMQNLNLLIENFPSNRKALAETVRAYCFWVVPDRYLRFRQHYSNAYPLLEKAKSVNIFLNDPQLLLESIMYLTNVPIHQNHNFSTNSLCQASTKVIEYLLQAANPHAAVKVCKFLNLLFNHRALAETRYLVNYFSRLTEMICLAQDKMFDDYFFSDWIRHALFRDNQIIFRNGVKRCTEMACKISLQVFERHFLAFQKRFASCDDVAKNDKALSSREKISENQKKIGFLTSLFIFLRQALACGSFSGKQANQKYFLLLEQVVPCTVGCFKDFLTIEKNLDNDLIKRYAEVEKKLLDLTHHTFMALLGLEDCETHPGLAKNTDFIRFYTLKVKNKRASLLVNWLFQLAKCSPNKLGTLVKSYHLGLRNRGFIIGKNAKKQSKELDRLLKDSLDVPVFEGDFVNENEFRRIYSIAGQPDKACSEALDL